MNGAALGVDFVELAGEQGRTVETRVERAVLLLGAAAYLDAAEHFVPTLLCFGLDGLEIGVADLRFEVAQRLFGRDERRSDARGHLLAAPGGEVNRREGVVALGLGAFELLFAVEDAESAERLVEPYHEVIAEIVGHTAAVAGGVAHDGAAVGHHLDVRPAVERVDDDAGLLAFGERETHGGGPVGRRDFGHDVVVGEVDLIVIGAGLLRLVREPAAARSLADLVAAAHGHQRKLPVVVDPRRGLVGLLETADGMGAVGIGPAVAHGAGLGGPEVHAPREGYGGVGVARGERIVGLRTHERGDVLRGAERRFGSQPGVAAATEGRKGEKRYFFHGFQFFVFGQAARTALRAAMAILSNSANRVFRR